MKTENIVAYKCYEQLYSPEIVSIEMEGSENQIAKGMDEVAKRSS